MRIAVVGVGGVGGYFGGRLAQAGQELHLIARAEHLDAIRRDGLRVRSVAGDFEVRVPATDDPAEVGPVDHVLFCVKSYDTGSAAASLPAGAHGVSVPMCVAVYAILRPWAIRNELASNEQLLPPR